ncbi:immunity protein YezG family protein [Fluviispira vulneris]|uniref:immunity protein YezG family protein n=1 Tax=Fluviispira vulneris TaxID=2763012 RepID=UPI0016492C52|nr:hypothetical protein [Fluviispira vulneris]
MSHDINIYNKIGIILMDMALKNSKFILMRAELSQENDVCKFEFDCIDNENQLKWLTAGNEYGSQLNDLLVELRQFYISQNQPSWKGCEFRVNLETGKYSIDFIYD